jgi:hypothetical protein
MRKAFRLVIFLCFAGLLLMFLYSPVVRAQQDTVVRCRFETSQIDIGAETIITLEVLDVVDLFAIQLDMAFDADLAEVSGSPGDPEDNRMQLGDFLISDFEVYNEIHNDFGAIFIALTQFVPSPPQSGSGELAYGYVSGLQEGTVEFIFEEVILLDPDGQEIPHNRENCTLSIGTGKQVTETPTEVFTASPTNTATNTLTPPSSTPVPSDTLTATQTQLTPGNTQPPEPTRTSSPTVTVQASLTQPPGPSITLTVSPTPQSTGIHTISPTPQPTSSLTVTLSPLPIYPPTSEISPTPLPSIVIITETPTPSSSPTIPIPPTSTLTIIPTPAPRPASGLYVALCAAFCFAMLALIFVIAGIIWYIRQAR